MKNIILGLLVLFVITFGVFVWPTVYKYEKVDFGRIKTVIKINRFTGDSQMLLPDGWKRMGTAQNTKSDYLDRFAETTPLVPEGYVLDRPSDRRQ